MLEVRELTKRFGTNLAVDGLTFTARPGSVLGFLGPNGAGKTTTLRMLLGLTLPTSGAATVDGRSYRELDDPIQQVGAVLEGPQFHPGRTGRNHLRVIATAAGLPPGRVDEVLGLVELNGAGAKRLKTYSLGMRQRLSLAGALLGDPRALVLDEPANGLDPQGIRWLRDFLRAEAGHGRAVLVSSHVLAEMSQTVDRVVVISHGRLVAEGSLEELTGAAESPVWVRTPEPDRLAAALTARAGANVERAGGGDGAAGGGDGVAGGGDGVAGGGDRVAGAWLAVRGATLEEVGGTAAENGIAVFELYRPRQSLEAAFLDLTGGTEAGR